MRKLVTIFAMVGLLAVAGCANLKNAYSVLTEAKVSPQLVVVAANTFNALEATATNYLRLPRCVTGGTAVCRSPQATAVIIPAIRSGRVARVNLVTFLRDHPNELGSKGTYDALIAANGTLTSIFTQYKVGVAR